jgi:NhaA family Na+:H+ antiporter
VRQAASPLAAAVGGMLAPALIYLTLVQQFGPAELARGWAIPCATDIAFSYLTARLIFGADHPVIPFLLLLAIADDAFGLMVLAAFYPSGTLRLGEFAIVLASAIGLAAILRHRRIDGFWTYLLVPGVLSWLAFYRGGLHPALALVPIVPFLSRAHRDPGLFVSAPARARDALSELEHWWKVPVEIILCAFGLVNAGIALDGIRTGAAVVLAAVLLGKPIGIVAASAIGRAVGFRLPADVTARDLVVTGFAAAIGFTVALFFATAAFPAGPLLDQAKLGALLTVSGAGIAAAAAALLRVGRFAR